MVSMVMVTAMAMAMAMAMATVTATETLTEISLRHSFFFKSFSKIARLSCAGRNLTNPVAKVRSSGQNAVKVVSRTVQKP